MVEVKEVYLGDGLYASFDGYIVKLRAPRLVGDHWVGLDPDVLAAFEEFVAIVRERIARERARGG